MFTERQHVQVLVAERGVWWHTATRGAVSCSVKQNRLCTGRGTYSYIRDEASAKL